MKAIKKEVGSAYVDIPAQNVRVRAWDHGHTDIICYDVPENILEDISEITQKPIKEREQCRWILFAKARDGSQVTLFQE